MRRRGEGDGVVISISRVTWSLLFPSSFFLLPSFVWLVSFSCFFVVSSSSFCICHYNFDIFFLGVFPFCNLGNSNGVAMRGPISCFHCVSAVSGAQGGE